MIIMSKINNTILKYRCLLCLLMTLTIYTGCSKKGYDREPLSTDETIPQQVSDISVVNGKGFAVLSYTVPADQSLLYVKASYRLGNGSVKEVKASYYENQLVLDGFADTLAHEVKVYSVNRAEKTSEPVIITVKPLTNPIWDVYQSLSVTPDFSGIAISALNDAKADVAIQLLTKKSGSWNLYSGIYTKLDTIKTTIRGFDTIPVEVAVTVRDRFLNTTDTIFKTISPLYEALLDKSMFRSVNLPGEPTYNFYNQNSRGITALWDGIISGSSWPWVVWTNSNSIAPQHVTFDIGRLTKLSRMAIYEYSENPSSGSSLRNYYYGGNLRHFEVWGSDNPAPDGSYANWDLLGTYEVKKPSGLPYGTLSNEDHQAAAAGFNCSFTSGDKRYRYLRIKCNKNWVGTTYMTLVEAVVYGDPR